MHTFTATLKTAGTQSIAIADTADSAITGSGSGILVTPAAAASFAVAGFPATTAGVAQNYTVTARDAFGNVATGYAGTVAFGSSDALTGLPASYSFTAADAGVHTFSATLDTAGTQSIIASDATTGITGSQTGISVTAATATHFSISAPSSAVAGKSFSITVTALDAYGNTATTYRGKVHFADSAGNANLPSDYSFSAGDNGVHVFSFTLNTAVVQTITVVDAIDNSIIGSATVSVSSSTSGGGSGSGGGGGSGGGKGSA
jgi:hypothetical protein